jgi:hypothetical protein
MCFEGLKTIRIILVNSKCTLQINSVGSFKQLNIIVAKYDLNFNEEL